MFAADYWCAPHPAVLRAVSSLGENWKRGPYGSDELTKSAQNALRTTFGLSDEAGVFFLPTGTAGNLLATSTLIPHSWQALMCAAGAHMTTFEAGGPESRGHKIIELPQKHGKIDLSHASEMISAKRADTHQVFPAMLAIANATELGTRYTQKELLIIREFAVENNMLLHMDGSRLAYAMMATELPEIFKAYGFATLMLGLTKVGALGVDALIVADPKLAREVAVYYHKQLGYMAARMQGYAVQVLAMLAYNLWLRNGEDANGKAIRLRDALWKKLKVDAAYPVETNAVFAAVPRKVGQALKEGGWAYIWYEPVGDSDGCIVRFMTSWATTEEDIDALIAFLEAQLFS